MTPAPSGEVAALLERSLAALQAKTEAHDGTWHLGQADWSVDQDAGTIVFACPGGITATAPVQIIGTYDTNKETWLWGWDHPSVVPALQASAKAVRDYGAKHKVPSLTTRKVECDESEAWEFTALACELTQAQGAYRGPAGPTLIFMTFGTVTLNK